MTNVPSVPTTSAAAITTTNSELQVYTAKQQLFSDVETISKYTAGFGTTITNCSTEINKIIGIIDTLKKDDIEGLNEQIEALKKQRDTLVAVKEQIEAEKTEAEDKLNKINQEIKTVDGYIEKWEKERDARIAKLNQYVDDYDKTASAAQAKTKAATETAEDLADTDKKVKDAVEDAQEETEENQESALKAAIKKYENGDKKGSLSDAIIAAMSDGKASKGTESKVNSLTNKANSLSSVLDSYNSQLAQYNTNLTSQISTIKTQVGVVDTAVSNLEKENSEKTKLTTAQGTVSQDIANLNTYESNRSDVEATATKGIDNTKNIITSQSETVQNSRKSTKVTTKDALLNMVSEEELAFVDSEGLNLTEKLADGYSPRYVFAPGEKDGKYHIYDMADKDQGSLARLYGEKTNGSSNLGLSITAYGNGYMENNEIYSYDEAVAEKKGASCYYLSDESTVKVFYQCYDTYSPLSFDTDGNGVTTSDEVVNFDIDGDGTVDKINDSDDAVLVFDKDKDGLYGEDGSECFGNNTDLDNDGKADGYKNGFDALKALAKKEGLIDNQDDMKLDSDDLKILEDKYGLKIKLKGYNSEAVSLSDIGISEINLASTDETKLVDNFDEKGNQLMTQDGATFVINGETREYSDIWHKKIDTSEDGTNNGTFASASSISFNIDTSILDEITDTQDNIAKSITKTNITTSDAEYDMTVLKHENRNFFTRAAHKQEAKEVKEKEEEEKTEQKAEETKEEELKKKEEENEE